MPKRDDIKSVLVIGSGPIVIGQAVEFDYSGTQACRVLRDEGIRVVLVNSNPATIMTDPEFADATYIEPIEPGFLEKVIEAERPDALPSSTVDPDGDPVWSVLEGAELVPGVQAWNRLGVGGRCEVWLGWCRVLWAPVVVKLPRPHQVDHPRARASLAREVRALDGVLHPHLPRLYRADLAARLPYLVEEHVDGPDLAEHTQVLGHLRLSDPEYAHQVVHGALPVDQRI